MAQRLVKILVADEFQIKVKDFLEAEDAIATWIEPLEGKLCQVTALFRTEETGHILDDLETQYRHTQSFRIIVQSVEATIPRPPEPEEKKETEDASTGSASEKKEKKEKKIFKVNREELYADISDQVKLSSFYVSMVVLSSIVAGLGVLKASPAIIIGAMVIAPMLGPNVALAFAATLGDFKLGLRAALCGTIGTVVALIMGFIWGLCAMVDPKNPEIVSRTVVDGRDIVLALASGTAGVLSLTVGVSSVLVGVMIAVALMPPLVVCGLLAGDGHWALSFGAFTVFFVNVICINISGVATFYLKGVRPLRWWEAKRAKASAGIALGIWLFLLAILISIMILSKKDSSVDNSKENVSPTSHPVPSDK